MCTLIPHAKLTFAPNADKHRCLAADSQVRIDVFRVISIPCMKIDIFKSFLALSVFDNPTTGSHQPVFFFLILAPLISDDVWLVSSFYLSRENMRQQHCI